VTRSYLVAARRTAVAPCNGRFAQLSVHGLAAPVVNQVIKDAGLVESQVNELIVANSLGEGGNPARVIALASGLPISVAGLSIDRQCAGGLDALLIADAMIRAGHHEVVIAGGAESYSRQPIRQRTFADGSQPKAYTQAQFTPWPEKDPDMAQAADSLARYCEITREEQDDWAIESHRKARHAAANETGQQILNLEGLEHDSFTRKLNRKICQRAPIVCGSITSANMAVAADAAAFAVLVSEEIAKTLDTPKIEFENGKTVGCDPEILGFAAVQAILMAIQAADLDVNSITHAEIMEAFAVQAIACQRHSGLSPQIINPFGGALARGHPIGASGAILCVNLFHGMRRRPGIGLAAIAAAGGLGSAAVLKSH